MCGRAARCLNAMVDGRLGVDVENIVRARIVGCVAHVSVFGEFLFDFVQLLALYAAVIVVQPIGIGEAKADFAVLGRFFIRPDRSHAHQDQE
jgi:hypothetical protein